jgi:hypothetical protein
MLLLASQGPNSSQSARFKMLIDDAEETLLKSQQELTKQERLKHALMARLDLLQALTNKDKGDITQTIALAMIKEASDHHLRTQAAQDKQTIQRIAASARLPFPMAQAPPLTADLQFDELPDSLEAFVHLPHAPALIQRAASMSPPGHQAIHSEFIRRASTMIAHVECHRKESLFYLDLSRVRVLPSPLPFLPLA